MTPITVFKARGQRENYDSFAAAATAAGIPYMTYYMRLRNGWTAAEASTTPVRGYLTKARKAKKLAKAKKDKARRAAKAKAFTPEVVTAA